LDRKIPLSICSEIALPFCGLVVDDHCSTWYERSAGVAHGASESHRCWLSGRAPAERRARIRRLGARCGTRESRCSTSPRSSDNQQSRTKDDFSIVRFSGDQNTPLDLAECCHQANGDAQEAIQIDSVALQRAPGPSLGGREDHSSVKRDWYYAKDGERGYFLAMVNAKGSSSMRTFDASDGRFLGKRYKRGRYQEAFKEYIENSLVLRLTRRPSLERECRERLPEDILAELKSQTRSSLIA
jgi:hypothetical protein